MNIQNSSEETHKQDYGRKQIMEHHQIENTPFMLVRQNDDWFIVMGDSRITDNYPTREQAIERLTIEPWFITLTMMVIVTNKAPKIQKEFKDSEGQLGDGG